VNQAKEAKQSKSTTRRIAMATGTVGGIGGDADSNGDGYGGGGGNGTRGRSDMGYTVDTVGSICNVPLF
jgi:hypothetical protein